MRNQWSEAGFLDKCTITYDAVGIIGAHIKYSNKAMIIRMGNYDIFR